MKNLIVDMVVHQPKSQRVIENILKHPKKAVRKIV